MGETLFALVTKVSRGEWAYQLWEKEQVVVLLSRTRKGKDTIFVGDAEEVAETLAELLQIPSQYSEYMSYILDCLTKSQTPGGYSPTAPVIEQTQHVLRPIDIELPSTDSGFVYILVSLQDKKSLYIGQTTNLVRRLRDHNRGAGAKATAEPLLRPWALLAYVTGFGKDTRARQRFEGAWKHERDRLSPLQQTPGAVANCARTMLEIPCWKLYNSQWHDALPPAPAIDGTNEPIQPLQRLSVAPSLTYVLAGRVETETV